MKVLITGGSGLVGTRLTGLLRKKKYDVAHLSRGHSSDDVETFNWDIGKRSIEDKALDNVDYVIHLAGAGVADKRWSQARKSIIKESRTHSTELLYTALAERTHQVKGFVAASAIGYYGMDTGDVICTESSGRGNDFLADVVIDWEKSTSKIRDLGIPVTQLRIGIVLDNQGGALEKMAQPIKLGAGAPIGSGNQWMSWIHIDDLCRMIIHGMEKGLDDVYNAVSPNPVTNKMMTKALAKALKKPLFAPNVPPFVLKIMFGEMADILLGGNKVSAEKISASDFRFQFAELEKALKDLYG